SAPAGGSPSFGAAAGGLQIPDPLIRLRQMARALKAANPTADNATLAAALDKQVATLKGMAPEDKALMQAQLGLINAQERYYAANTRSDDTRRGQDVRAGSVADTNAARLQGIGIQQAGANARNANTVTGAMNRTQALIAARQSLEGGQPLPDNVR